jgi:hypothetical protein
MVRFQPTPNPNAGKFVVGRPVVEGRATKSYSSVEQASSDSVAVALFGVEGVASLFMADDFITVMKRPDADWGTLVPNVVSVIEQNMR